MRIRTQLLAAVAGASLVALVIVAALLHGAQRSAAGLQAQADNQDVARALANLLALTQELTVYGGERATTQWHAQHARLVQTVEGALARSLPAQPARLSLGELRERVLDLQPLYARLVQAFAGPDSDLAQRRRELMVERLVSEMQELVDARHRWGTAIAAEQRREYRVVAAIVLAAAAALVLLLVGLVVAVARRGLVPLARLQAAASAIERGDLSVRCESRSDDELGATARAVNAMAQSLLAANAALRESEQRYQLAVAGAEQGIWDWNLTRDLLYLSPRAQQLLGIEPGEAVRGRRRWLALQRCHEEDRPAVRAAIGAALRGDTRLFEVEHRAELPSGAVRWFRYRGAAVRDASGRAYRMAGSMEDVTERRLAQAERERLAARLRQAQKLEAMGTLAGGIAHDFNNILGAVLGFGEMAQQESREGTALRRHVDAVMTAGLRAKALVARILLFSRAGMGETVPVPVQATVTETLDQLAVSLPPGVQLERELEGGDAAVMGDPTQVHQVVMNLCTNAVQAMPRGGRLTVTLCIVQVDEPLTVTTHVLRAGTYLRLGVHDTGTGIARTVIDRIFDPFFSTKGVGAGTGLGLSLVHGIVADLDGGIDVASEVGRGTTFSVYLPRHGTATVACVADEGTLPRGRGQTVLLVDDEEVLVQVGEEMLARLGYEPVGFACGSQALEDFRREPRRYDAALLDEAMPGLAGTELALQMRELSPRLPIVLMSGYVTPELAARAQAAGIAEVLAKPLASGDIARSLAGALGP
ncbi:MAG: response regulator [Rubrivivax sp.]|nr:response regulator [Rubrivivax sp.]